jgi:hypothetical protein
MSTDIIISDFIYTKRYSPSRLYKNLQRLHVFEDIITTEKEFPSFDEFKIEINDQQRLHSIADGIKALKAFSDFEPLTGAKKAENQSELMEKRDKMGLLGKTVSRPINQDLKQKKKVQSVRTVKKK